VLPLRVAICGAGTGVGKTHVACALAIELVRRGRGAIAQKAVESGFSTETSDAARLALACGQGQRRPLYAFAEAVSPHLAARAERIDIDVEAIANWITGPAWIVETAGGLLSPLSARATNLDLIARLDPTTVVLVVADRLGALHDTRACQLALAQRALDARTRVVLSAVELADASSGRNAAELEALGWAVRVVSFPRAALDHPHTRRAASTLADAIGDPP
jgi:dethiobiotin synthetase